MNTNRVFVIPPEGIDAGWTITRREAEKMFRDGGHPELLKRLRAIVAPVIRLSPPTQVTLCDVREDREAPAIMRATGAN